MKAAFRCTLPDGTETEGSFAGDMVILASGHAVAKGKVTILESWVEFSPGAVVTATGFVVDTFYPTTQA